MRYKLAIFDLDGTILDTLEDLADSTNYALSVYHMPEHTIDEVRWFVGNGIHKLIERAVPKGSSDEQIEQVFTTFKEYYKDHCAVKTRPHWLVASPGASQHFVGDDSGSKRLIVLSIFPHCLKYFGIQNIHHK